MKKLIVPALIVLLLIPVLAHADGWYNAQRLCFHLVKQRKFDIFPNYVVKIHTRGYAPASVNCRKQDCAAIEVFSWSLSSKTGKKTVTLTPAEFHTEQFFVGKYTTGDSVVLKVTKGCIEYYIEQAHP